MGKLNILKRCIYYLLFSLTVVLICFLFFIYFESDKKEIETGSLNITDDVDISLCPIIIIDPGHGGEDGGCSGKDGTTEKDLNFSLSQKLYSLLKVSGYNAIMTRTEDKLLYDKYNDLPDYKGKKKMYDVKNRVKTTEEYSSPIFISIHMNAFPDQKYSGTQVYYSQNNSNSKTLASVLQTSTVNYLQKENKREIKKANSSIYVLDRLTCPAVLVECGFLSNDEECKMLSSDVYQNKMSVIFCAALLNFTNSYINQ